MESFFKSKREIWFDVNLRIGEIGELSYNVLCLFDFGLVVELCVRLP